MTKIKTTTPLNKKMRTKSLVNYFIDNDKELAKILETLGYSKNKKTTILKQIKNIKKIDKELYWYLVIYRFLKEVNILWEKTWKIYTYKRKTKSKAGIVEIKQAGFKKIRNTDYKWFKLPGNKLYYLINEKTLNSNLTIDELYDSIIAILDKNNTILFSSRENEIINNLSKKLRIDIFSNKIPSYIIKEILWKTKNITQAILNCRKEISGTDGINKIIFNGEDVARGISELNNRQEIDLSRLGTWTEVETTSLKINTNGEIRFKKYNTFTRFFKNVKKYLILNKLN
ncbi:MAG: hypothetical protein ACTSQY_09200 [Candidatus Odinarchaeia archaeon]